MKSFIAHYARQLDGVWLCVSDGEFQGSSGRIRVTSGSQFAPGTMHMGVDLAKLLEEEFVRPTIGVPIVARIADVEVALIVPKESGVEAVFPKAKLTSPQ